MSVVTYFQKWKQIFFGRINCLNVPGTLLGMIPVKDRLIRDKHIIIVVAGPSGRMV